MLACLSIPLYTKKKVGMFSFVHNYKNNKEYKFDLMKYNTKRIINQFLNEYKT